MAVPLESRCFFHRCRSAGAYRFRLTRRDIAVPQGQHLRDWLTCLEHRDFIESLFGQVSRGETIHLVPKVREPRKKSTVIAALAGAGENPQG